jgi:hypothetical protein
VLWVTGKLELLRDLAVATTSDSSFAILGEAASSRWRGQTGTTARIRAAVQGGPGMQPDAHSAAQLLCVSSGPLLSIAAWEALGGLGWG